MSLTCRVVHEAHGLPEPWLTLLHLMVCCTEQNATIDFCLTMDDSRQVAVLTHTKQFLWAVFTTMYFPLKLMYVTFLLSIFTATCFYKPNWQHATIGSSNALATNKHKAITWSDFARDLWLHVIYLGFNEQYVIKKAQRFCFTFLGLVVIILCRTVSSAGPCFSWRKRLSERVIARLLTHICVNRPQWV